jgi:hypothetical protein
MTGPVPGGLGWVAGSGSVLGAVALAVDELSGAVGGVIRGVAGAAFAWGAAALLAGYMARGRRAAQVRAIVVLVTATLVYYGLIVAIGHRWRGATLADGSSAVWVSLASVGRAVLLWLGIALVAGGVLGWLGDRIRSGSRYSSTIAAGVATGLLAGQPIALAVMLSGWPAWDQVGWSLLGSAGVAVLLAIAVPATMLYRAPSKARWPMYLAAALITASLAAGAWLQIEALRSAWP